MKATVTVGLPASGKSTFALRQRMATELNLDTLRGCVCGDPSNQAASWRAIGLRNRWLVASAANRQNVILSDTHARARDRRKVIRQLRALGYRVEVVFFNVSEAICRKRNAQRAEPVPEEAIARMARSLMASPPSPAEADLLTVICDPEDPLINVESSCTFS